MSAVGRQQSLHLSAVYFFYFASLGVFVPYWSPYLASLSFSETDIGVLVAVAMGTKIFAPYIWGWVADHTGHRTALIRIASSLSALTFAGIFLDQSFIWLVIVMAVYSFFWNAVLPQFEAATMNHAKEDHGLYSSIRLWGSVGFIITAVLLGWWQQAHGVNSIAHCMLVMLFGIAGISFVVKDQTPESGTNSDKSIWPVLRQPYVAAFFVACFLIQLSHGSYYTFFSIYLEDAGYSKLAIGWLWGLGVIAEVVVFIYMRRLMQVFGIFWLLMLSMALTSLRWVLIAWCVSSLPILLFAQLLHAASFGIFHAAAIVIVHQAFKGRLQSRGQALYSSSSFGAGGAAGALLSGELWVRYGGEVTYLVAASVAAAGVLVVWFGMKSLKNQPLSHG